MKNFSLYVTLLTLSGGTAAVHDVTKADESVSGTEHTDLLLLPDPLLLTGKFLNMLPSYVTFMLFLSESRRRNF